MAKRSVSNTALGAAVCRLIEQYQPDETRLFNDPIIKDMISTPLRFAMQFAPMRALTINRTEAAAKGIYGAQVCRTCFIDETVEAALAKGITQLVILGAGYDTRAYRLKGVEQVKVFEVDLPHVQADKKAKVQQRFGRIPAHVTFILSISIPKPSMPDLPDQPMKVLNRQSSFGKVLPSTSPKRLFVRHFLLSANRLPKVKLFSHTFSKASSNGVRAIPKSKK